jgi:3-hydroxyacyl-CoA dehydrogenase/enoyl-CoA hydratase/3-hydroxybutyryl-CoA epimerase
MEASRMLDEGYPFNWIEEAAVQFGLPMGPFTLVDELGLPLCFSVANKLHAAFGARFTPPIAMKLTAAAGLRGKSSGSGCYHWDASGRKLEINPEFTKITNMTISDEKASPEQIAEIQHRLIFVIVDEAARCLEEKVVRKPRELDLALVIGSGFPPFRGGVLRYADSFGIPKLIEELNKTYTTCEPKRQVSNLLTSMSESGRRFYSSGAN